jgi:hypothetical protein
MINPKTGGASFTTPKHSYTSTQTKATGKQWHEYETWDKMYADKEATAAYFAQRTALLENPALDWSKVLKVMQPKLHDNHEHIGIANVEADGRTMYLVAHEASPITIGDESLKNAFAAVPGDLVAKYAERPGLVIFHTHPADVRGSPLPSSTDLATAIYFDATSRFAASAVISRYGVLMHTLSIDAHVEINERSKDWKLAMLNMSHDVCAAHEAIRSWSSWKLDDYIKFYARHRMFMIVFPSSEMIGDSHRYTFQGSFEHTIDHDLLDDRVNDIKKHITGQKLSDKNKAAFSHESGVAIQFD